MQQVTSTPEASAHVDDRAWAEYLRVLPLHGCLCDCGERTADALEGRFAPRWSFHFGLVLMGWGIFNLVEGIVDHHLLGVHHVRDDVGSPMAWDIGFLVFGGLLVLVGWLMHKRGVAAMSTTRRR